MLHHPARASLRAAAALALLAFAPAAHAQRSAPPPRPEVPRGADANDWEAYFDTGVKLAQQEGNAGRAADAFYWAGRLDPTRAEPLHGRWVAFWLRNDALLFEYMEDRGDVFVRPDVIANDSLRWRATMRNPFFPRGLDVLIYQRLGTHLRSDPWLRALSAYTTGNYRAALTQASSGLASDRGHESDYREMRQLAFAAGNQLDSAAAETKRMLDLARARDRREQVVLYQGKQVLAYELGILSAARGDLRGAREVLADALVEDMSFYPAHAALADVALATRDTATALAEYGQAIGIAGIDPVVRFRYGTLLLRTGKYADAAAQFRAASQAEPWWADAYLNLGVALEAAGDNAGAGEAYRQFIAHAPRRMSDTVARIQQRMANLAPTGGAPAAPAPPSER